MEDIKVSIIIPVFNTSKYLRQCLDSVISQTLHEIEIICIDDGSTDGSLEILKEYAKNDSKVKVLIQNHKRQGAARNYGMSVAKGEYIGFVDSDDWCEIDMFEKLYQKAKDTESDITMCAVTTFNDNNSNEFSKSNTYANLDIFSEEFFNRVFAPKETLKFLMDICVYPANKIIKRDFILSNNLRFNEKMYYEDGPFFYDIWLAAKRITLIKDFGYFYRMYSDTSTCFSNDYNKLHNFKALKEKKYILKKHKVFDSLKKEFNANKRKSILYWLYRIKDRKAKFLYLVAMLFEMPNCFFEPLVELRRELSLFFKILFNKKDKIAFWGASLFLEKFILKYRIKNKRILGVIDKNPAKENTKVGEYICYSPEKMKELNVDKVIITILNFSKKNEESIKKYLKEVGLENIKVDTI